MKVNENSWHYKMVTYNDGPYTTLPMTVCGYFWAVVWAIVKRAGSILRIVSVVSLFVFAIGSVFNFIFIGAQDGQGTFQLLSLMTGAFILVVMAIGAVLGFIIFLAACIHILILHILTSRLEIQVSGIGQSSFCLYRLLKILKSSEIRWSKKDPKMDPSERPKSSKPL